ncbi:hypothetical protein ACP_1460 [Acidobacterium capsulatum ATCC 51196]|uniref:Uncharacterized protein n=2 Tax=Acidobacteriaceae TaxID=204434 RepID=C1F651_ACIC5|nr:hypothetical protein ACP_1460 [Acidobacterium capsulatum ATCC 51196]
MSLRLLCHAVPRLLNAALREVVWPARRLGRRMVSVRLVMHFVMQFQGMILGVVFLGMIVTPAIVAARSGKEESQPEAIHEDVAEIKAQPARPLRSAAARSQEVIMPISKVQAAPNYTSTVLPIHGRMGMAGR